MFRSLFHSSSSALILAVAFLSGGVAPAAAQAGSDDGVSPRFGLRVAAGLYGSGDDVNCAYLPSASLGAEARTRGIWFGALSLDLMQTAPSAACTLMLPIVTYDDDRYAEEFAGAQFHLSPRVGVRGGRTFSTGRMILEPALGGGVVQMVAMDSFDSRIWKAWTGGSFAVRRSGSRFALQGEYGWHATPVRHEIHRSAESARDEYVTTRSFERWRPTGQLGVQVGWQKM